MKSIKILLFALIGILSSCNDTINFSDDSIKAVPKDAIFIVKSNNIGIAGEKLSNTNLWKIVDDSKSVQQMGTQLRSLNEFLKQNEINLADKPMIFSLHLIGHLKFDYLAVFQESNISSQSKSKLEKYIKLRKEYDGASILEFHFPSSSEPFYSCSYKGMTFFSRNQIIIETSIRQLNASDNLFSDKDFEKLHNSINNKLDFNILVNFERLKHVEDFNDTGEFNFAFNFAKWMEFDLEIDQNELFMSGLASSNDSINKFIDIFLDEKPRKISNDNVLPSSTSFAVSYGFDNFVDFRFNYIKFLKKTNNYTFYKQDFENLHNLIVEEYSKWIENEISIASVYANNKPLNTVDLFLIRTKDSEKALNSMQKISDAEKTEFRSYQIGRLTNGKYINFVLSPNIVKLRKPYYTIIEDVLIFSDDISLVKESISNYLDSRSLSNYGHFESLKKKLSPKSNILLYFKNPNFAKSLKLAFPNLKALVDNNLKEIEKYKSGAFQLSFDGDYAFVNILVGEAQEEIGEVKNNWQLDFDSALSGNICTFYNHSNKTHEVLVQDLDSNLHLISAAGKLLWSRKLDGMILGSIKQADLYKNNKNQMLFNTEKSVYAIDRNGKNVENFPIKLKNNATAPLAVFDYDNNRDYRILVTSNGTCSMFDSKAKRVTGFSFSNSNITITAEPQHFRVKGKDYILVLDTNGKILLLDRQGSIRIPFKEKYIISDNKFYLVEAETHDKSYLISNTDDSQVLRIYMNGSSDLSLMDTFENKVIFQVYDNETITVQNNKVKWKNPTKSELTELGEGEIDRVLMKKINGEYLLSLASSKDKKIYIIGQDMEVLNGFPLFGEFMGEIVDYDLDGKLDIPVVSNEDKGVLKLYGIN